MLTPPSTPPTLRLGIYRTSSLGDVVLATACLDLLEQLPVPVEITWVGRGAALEMVSKSWANVKAVELGKSDSLAEIQRSVSKLAQCHFLIDLQCNLRSQWFSRALRTGHGVPYFQMDKSQVTRSRLIIEARLRGRRRPLPARVTETPRHQYQSMLEALKRGLIYHLPVESRDGLDSIRARPRLPVPADFDPAWRKELRFGPWLAIAPGAAHPTKRAPLHLFTTAVKGITTRLQQDPRFAGPLGLLIVGDAKDRDSGRDLLDTLGWTGPVMNLAGRLSLWETGVALSEATCLLSNDSSLGHIAEAVDTPVGILFGPTVEAFGFSPCDPRSRAFSALVGCRPCSKHGKTDCRFNDKLCFEAIDVTSIIGHLAEMFLKPDNRTSRRQPTLSKDAESSGTPGNIPHP